jgi:hypothetical protein
MKARTLATHRQHPHGTGSEEDAGSEPGAQPPSSGVGWAVRVEHLVLSRIYLGGKMDTRASCMPTRGVRVALIAMAVLVGMTVPATSASGQVNDWICLVPDAGFTDVDPASVHKFDIDCLAFYGITSGTTPTTYEPKGIVNRWQMALFMIRTSQPSYQVVVTGDDQGFTDIGHLPASSQTAINQVARLGITTGTTPETYAPDDDVNRSQMALFLTRLLTAHGIVLPPGTNRGFTDIAGLPAETQTAINQLALLGITTGTSATTYGPENLVTREQMASFLIRTLKIIWTLDVFSYTPDCTEEDAVFVCTGATFHPPDTTFGVRQFQYADLPFPSAADQAVFYSEDTEVEIWLDGSQQDTIEQVVSLPGVIFKLQEVSFPGGLSGTHDIEVRYYVVGELVGVDELEIIFS